MSMTTRPFAGFGKKTQLIPAPSEGDWLGYMLPTQTEGVGQFGPYVRIEYNIFVPYEDDYLRYVQSEIVSLPERPTTEDPLVQRLCAANGLSPSLDVDLSRLRPEGFVIVSLIRKDNYLRIARVRAVGDLQIPDIKNPAEKPLREVFTDTKPPF